MRSQKANTSGLVGDLAFATLLVGFCVWYLYDAWTASSTIPNLVLIAPVGVAAVIFYAATVVVSWRQHTVRQAVPRAGEEVTNVGVGSASDTDDEPSDTDEHGPPGARRAQLIFCVLLLVYVLSWNLIGADLATALFIAASLILQGDRSVVRIVVYSVVFAVATIKIFESLMTTPLPTTLL